MGKCSLTFVVYFTRVSEIDQKIIAAQIANIIQLQVPMAVAHSMQIVQAMEQL